MKALILAAGYATRLYPLTKTFPKPLLEVRQKTIIDYIVDKLNCLQPIDEIVVVTNTKFISRFRKWKRGLSCPKRITLVNDLTKDPFTRRGAIGDMDFTIDKKNINDDLLVIGGDNLFDGSLEGFLSFAQKVKENPVIGIYNVKSKNKAREYGVVELDKKNRIIDFQEKPKHPKSALVAMCLYYLPRQRLGLIKRYLRDKSRSQDAAGSYIDWLRNELPVYGFLFGGNWYDIGDHKFYKEANKRFARD